MRRSSILIGLLILTFLHPAAAQPSKMIPPTLYLAFSSDQHTILEITRFVDLEVMSRLRNLMGVAGVAVFGERRAITRLELDSTRLAAYGLTTQDVSQALLHREIKIAPGRSEGGRNELIIQTRNERPSPAELGEVILKQIGGAPIHLSDVGQIQSGFEDIGAIANFKGKRVIAIGVVKQWWATPSVLLASIQTALPTLQALLPEDIKMEIGDPTTISIEQVPSR